jgi:hypothetical protein
MLQVQKRDPISADQLDTLVEVAARAAGYEDGFGRRGCDLAKTVWWAAYIRQSLEEQTQNNRLPDYLRTCALEAKRLGAVVPREYVLYDAVTGEHLERPNMIRALDRLSREPLHQQIFEVEATHYGVQLHYADAPNGSDPASQFARSILAHAAKLVKLANRKNARAGNIGRVVKGWVPASRAAHGYRYRADREIAPDGRVIIKRAWWEIKELGPDGMPLWESPAWMVAQLFTWIGAEERSLYWATNKLNEMGIKAPEGGRWSPAKVANVIHHRCYTGNHVYNANVRMPNSERPLGDITAEVKRTLLRPKPREEWVEFEVPALVTEELWQKANANTAQRGRGRGKQGKSIQALLRNRIYCPKCGKPMVVRRDGRQNRVYYHCSKYFRPWAEHPCNYRKFVPGSWDELIWGDICTWLRDDAWVQQQLTSEQSQQESTATLIRLQQFKMSQVQPRIARVQEGFEGGIYGLEEAKKRIAEHQAAIAKAEKEIERLEEGLRARTSSPADLEAMRRELETLRERNLDEATFDDRLDIICKLGLRVYPSEDLKSLRVNCELNLGQVQPTGAHSPTDSVKLQADGESECNIECGKVMFGSPFCMKGNTRAFGKTLALVY